MNFRKKLLLISMLVMVLCCTSAVSAKDIDIDITDDAITDEIAVDGVSDIVEEIEIDDASDDVVDVDDASDNAIGQGNLRITTGTINGNHYSTYFNSDGTLKNNVYGTLNYTGYFDYINDSFGNYKITHYVTLNMVNATFNNIGFDLLADNLTLSGGTFNATATATNVAVINVGSEDVSVDGVEVNGVNINVTTPSNTDYFAINVLNAPHTKLLNNVINYEVPIATTNYNHIIRVVSSSNVTVYKNNITGKVPLKKVDFDQVFPSIYTDQVAGVAIQSSNWFNFTGNIMDIVGNDLFDERPTLDALIIVQSYNSCIAGNTIDLRDNVSDLDDTNYLYAVDVYECDDITIDGNVITINSKGGNLTVNGTGAAYGVQLTGPHTGVVISNNNITTANNGPNLGIYSQNYFGYTSLTITGNRINVTGRAGDNPWALVSGMELQDDYAYISGNIIRVNNTAVYDPDNCAYGISYSQNTYSIDEQEFYVYNNDVEVINGDWAIYLLMDNFAYGGNTLQTTTKSGDAAIYFP